MVNKGLFNLSWEKYLVVLFLLFGAGFFSSGIVTWVAANWDYFTKFQKLYAVQFWLSVSILAAIFFYYRESKKLATGKIKVVTSVFFFIAAVIIGALFALIGQIYQTGANTWQLFALWSALQIPLFLIMPNIGSALLLGATLNTTLILYFDTFHYWDYMFATTAALNFTFVLLTELYIRKSQQEIWHIVVKIANIALSVSLLGMAFSSNTQAVLALIISGALLFHYKMCSDMFLIIVYYVSTVVNFDVLLVRDEWHSGVFFGAAVITLIAIVFGGVQIRKRFFIYNPKLESGWAVQVMFSLLALLASALLIGWLYLLAFDDEIILLIASSVSFIVALFFHYRKTQDDFADALMAMSGVLLCVYFLTDYGIRYGESSMIDLITMSVYAALVYYLKPTLWLRCLAIILFISVLLREFDFAGYEQHLLATQETEISFSQQLFGYSAHQWLMLGAVISFYCKGRTANEKIIGYITPIAWAFLLLSFWRYLFTYFSIRYSFAVVDEVSAINSFTDLFHVLTGNIFINLQAKLWIYYGFYFVVALTALAVFLLLAKHFALKNKNIVIIAVVIALFSLSFISLNIIVFSLALLLLAYLNASRILFALAILSSLIALSVYYYMLAVPLLYKSFLLLLFGLLFAAVSVFLYKQSAISEITRLSESTQSAVENQPVFKLRPALTLATLVGILIFANMNIAKFEDVLNNGKPIILKLAPVDPRSLMQGDYMALNYEILNQVNEQRRKEQEDNRQAGANPWEIKELRQEKLYLLVKNDPDRVAQFCRLETQIPTRFDDCEAEVYLPLNATYWQPQLPSHSYFFAEGKGSYYARALYGEYRFKDGTALLFRLLDDGFNPL